MENPVASLPGAGTPAVHRVSAEVIPLLSASSEWHAVYVRHQHEKAVTHHLQRLEFRVFLPLYRQTRHWSDRRKHLSRPLFPGYVFFSGGLDRRLEILNTPGVCSLLMSGAKWPSFPRPSSNPSAASSRAMRLSPPIHFFTRAIASAYQPEPCQTPDWLGEIFEWVSCADEYSVKARDRKGRTPFEATYAGRHGVDISIPYAAVAMRGLQQEICPVLPRAEETPRDPQDAGSHFVIPTHDDDYFPLGRAHAFVRLVRNAIISAFLHVRPLLAASQAWQGLSVALRFARDPLDQIPALVQRELQFDIRSSYNFLVRPAHRRDAGYDLSKPTMIDTIRSLERQRMEVGLHGSYTSLDSSGQLRRERDSMQMRGIHVHGGRQHWLRFTLDRLIEEAGLEYDSSIGWSTRNGFRAGACFAFPPYSFAREAPADFLEFPLLVMDQALNGEGQQFHQVARLVAASRRWGWGGITLLWHPSAFSSGWLPREIGEIYWRLAADRERWNDCWMTASSFLRIARRRFVESGLLPADAPSRIPVEVCVNISRAASAGQPRAGPEVALTPKVVNA
jgi:hypothetical protein